MSLFIFYIFILGLLVGSFLNVVAFRYGTGMPIHKGHSICPNCSKILRWYELIPVISYLFLIGRCSKCKAQISWQYPVVEFITGLVFVGIFLRQYYYWPLYSGLSNGMLISILFFIYYAVVFSLLIVIVIYDIRHKIIPDGLVYSFMILAFGKLLLFVYYRDFAIDPSIIFNLLAPVFLFSLFALIWKLSGGRMIGFGDSKLVFGIGALLGFSLSINAVILAFWVGAIWGIILILISRFKGKGEINLQSEVPFAPFLIIGTTIIFFSHIDLLHLSVFGLS